TVRRGQRDVEVGRIAPASSAVIEEAAAGVSEEQQPIVRQYLEGIRQAGGALRSRSTRGKLRITLRSGIGGGNLFDIFARLQRDDPEAYSRLFGGHGIDVVAAGPEGDRGSGLSELRTTVPGQGEAPPETLTGDPAAEYIANNPSMLGV